LPSTKNCDAGAELSQSESQSCWALRVLRKVEKFVAEEQWLSLAAKFREGGGTGLPGSTQYNADTTDSDNTNPAVMT